MSPVKSNIPGGMRTMGKIAGWMFVYVPLRVRLYAFRHHLEIRSEQVHRLISAPNANKNAQADWLIDAIPARSILTASNKNGLVCVCYVSIVLTGFWTTINFRNLGVIMSWFVPVEYISLNCSLIEQKCGQIILPIVIQGDMNNHSVCTFSPLINMMDLFWHPSFIPRESAICSRGSHSFLDNGVRRRFSETFLF